MNQPLKAPSSPAAATGTTKRQRVAERRIARAERAEEDQRRQRARDRHQRADRKIDAAGRDDQRHADRDDDDGRDLGQVDVQRLQAAKCGVTAKLNSEQRDQRRQRGIAAKKSGDLECEASRLAGWSARQPVGGLSCQRVGSSCAIAAMIAGAVASHARGRRPCGRR